MLRHELLSLKCCNCCNILTTNLNILHCETSRSLVINNQITFLNIFKYTILNIKYIEYTIACHCCVLEGCLHRHDSVPR